MIFSNSGNARTPAKDGAAAAQIRTVSAQGALVKTDIFHACFAKAGGALREGSSDTICARAIELAASMTHWPILAIDACRAQRSTSTAFKGRGACSFGRTKPRRQI